MSLFTLSGEVSVNTREASQNVKTLNREVVELNRSLTKLAGGGGQSAVNSAKATANASAKAQIEAAKLAAKEKAQASKQAFEAAQQKERLTAEAARDTAKEQVRSAREATKAEVAGRKEAARAAEQTARQAAAAAQRSARAQTAAWKTQVAEGKQAANQLATSFARVAQIGGLAIVAGFGAGLKTLDDFDRKMRNVNSIAQLGTKGFNDLSASVQKISADPRIKKGPRDLAEGLYDVYSAGYKGAEALDILRESAVAASAGVSNTQVGVDAITTALRAHIKGVGTAREAANYYFQTVNDGKITFSQLTSAVGKSAAILNAGGVSMAEYGAYMADATLKGNKSAMATVALNNLIRKIGAPTNKAAKEFENLGIKFGYSELKAKGFTAKMQEISDKTKGNSDALAKLFPEQRSYIAALNITSNGMKSYNALLENQKHAHDGVGAAARASAKQNQGLSNDVDQAKKNLELFALTAAGVVAPEVSKLLNLGTGLLRNFQALPKETQESRIKMVAMAGAALLLVSPLKSIIETSLLVGKVFRGMGAAKALETQATLAHTAALEAHTAALVADTAAAAANAEASGASAAGSVGAAASTASFGAAFVALAAVAAVATIAVGAYKINQEAVNENNARLKASNANLVASNKQTATSFDVLKKAASIDAGATKTVADLSAQYEKLKGSAAGLEKFKKVALPQARKEIAVNVKLTMPQKAELNKQLDQVAGQIDANIGARKFDVQVKAEADKGALANVRDEFYRTYGWLYDQFKAGFVEPYLNDWKAIKGAATSAGSFIKTEWDSMLTSLDSKTNGAASKMAAAFQRLANQIGQSIKNAASTAWNWYNGRTANHGETDGPSLPAAPPPVKGAPKSNVWRQAHGLPSYDVGTSYVPKDQIALVHKGEIIIPAAESERIRGRRFDLQNRIDGLNTKIDARAVSRAQSGNRGRDGQLATWRAERTQLSHELAKLKREVADADRQQKARTKGQRDDLRAAAGDYETSAKRVQDATESTLDRLNKLRDGFKGLFESAQGEMVGMGDVSNPLGRRVNSWERFLGLTQTGRDAVAAGNSVKASVAPIASVGDYAPSGGGGGDIGRAKSLFEKNNLQSRVDMTCADVASATIKSLGINIKREAGAARLEAQVKAMGWVRIDPRSAPLGSAVFKPSKSARSGVHAMMSLGDGTLASSSNHKTDYFKARGSERAYAPPSSANMPMGGDYSGGGGSGFTPRRFELGDYALSDYRSLGKGWGAGLRSNDDNKNRFALQGKLAGGEMEGEIARIVEKLKDKGATAKFLQQTGFKLRAELPLREQAIDLLRQEANAQDIATNARRKANEEADKTAAALADNIAGVKAARVAIRAMVDEQARGVSIARAELEYRQANPNDEEGLTAHLERLQKIQEIQNSPEIVALRKGGRGGEADHVAAGLLGRYDGLVGIKNQIDAGKREKTKAEAYGAANSEIENQKFALQGRLDGKSEEEVNAALERQGTLLRRIADFKTAGFTDDDARALAEQLRARDDLNRGLEETVKWLDAQAGSADDVREAIGKLPSLTELAATAQENLGAALKDTGGDAASLREALAQIDPTLRGVIVQMEQGGEGAGFLRAKYAPLLALLRDINAEITTRDELERTAPERERRANTDARMGEWNADLEQRGRLATQFDPKSRRRIEIEGEFKRDGLDFDKAKVDEMLNREAWINGIEQIGDSMHSVFYNGFRDTKNGFKGMFDSILGGFNDMLQEMAAQYLANWVMGQIFGAFGGTLAGKTGAAPTGGSGSVALSQAGRSAANASIDKGFSLGSSRLGGSFASGLTSVPFDGFVARMHRNEAILTAGEADRWRDERRRDVQASVGGPMAVGTRGNASGNDAGGGGGGGPIHVNGPITIVANNTKQFERELTRQTAPRRETRRQARGALGV